MPLFLKGYPLILILYKMWRRLPPSQRRQLLLAARRHGPRVARTAVRQARARRRRGFV